MEEALETVMGKQSRGLRDRHVFRSPQATCYQDNGFPFFHLRFDSKPLILCSLSPENQKAKLSRTRRAHRVKQWGGGGTKTSPLSLKGHSSPHSLITKLFPYSLYALYLLFHLALFRFCFHPFASVANRTHPSSSIGKVVEFCSYSNGRWVRDKTGPLYNGSSCGTIKEAQNCISHGRPDLGFLYWRWKPRRCKLPRFEPDMFLALLSNKHLAFVGDSMARNQLESLLCMLATVSKPSLVYTSGEDNKFRTWHFASHNIVVSVYWSPFLIRGVEKSDSGPNYNELYVDNVDERWAGDLDHIDMIVLSIGHWFLHPTVYYQGGSVLGCHHCNVLNHTEIGFYGVTGKAVRTALETIIERKGGNDGNGMIDVLLTMFSPSHFEGEWDRAGACSRTRPYRRAERRLEGMDAEIRAVEVEEMEAARVREGRFGGVCIPVHQWRLR